MNVPRDRHPKAKLPADRNITVWRYMDKWKFEYLIKNQKLYLCRGDRLQDKFEGTYSRAQLLDMDEWLVEIGYEKQRDIERKQRESNRQSYYISSWCMSPYDLDLMWKAYTKDVQAIAVKSTISRLEAICDSDRAIEYDQLDISTVNYYGQAEGELIDYFADGFDAFVNKDYHFALDHEVRVLYCGHYKPSQPEEVLLPVDLSTLIERVVLAPGAKSESAEETRSLLDDAGLNSIPVESSRDDRELGI